MTEEIIGTLQGVSRHTYDNIFNLYFTRERVIAYITQSPDDVPPSFYWWNFLISSWFDKHRETRQRMKINRERISSLKELSVAELVSAHPSNFDIRFSNITFIDINRRMLEYRLYFHLTTPVAGRLVIDFILKKEQVILARDLLQKILSSKFKRP